MTDSQMTKTQIEAKYADILSEDPDNALELKHRGVDYMQNGYLTEASTDFIMSIVNNPDDIGAYHCLALIYYSNKTYSPAIKHWTRVLKYTTDPKAYPFFDALHMRAKSYLQMNDFENAIVDFSEVIRLGVSEELILDYIGRGFCYLRTGETDKARQDFQNALELDPNDETAKEFLENINN